MSSKYVPPHLRNKKQQEEPKPEVVEEKKPYEQEFPSLTNNSSVRVFDNKSGTTFASLATNWAKDAEKQQKETEKLKQENLENMEILKKRRTVPLPTFHNVRHFVEPEEESEQPKPQESNVDNEGWTEVITKKRYKKAKPLEEKFNRPPTPEEKADNTVWEIDPDDTYWQGQ